MLEIKSVLIKPNFSFKHVHILVSDRWVSPPQSCNTISKREALREYPSQGLLSYGPIRIEVPDRPESSELLFFTSSSCSPPSLLLCFMCFSSSRHPDHRGSSCGCSLDSGSLPHRPHQRGQSWQQEDPQSRSSLTNVLLLSSAAAALLINLKVFNHFVFLRSADASQQLFDIQEII